MKVYGEPNPPPIKSDDWCSSYQQALIDIPKENTEHTEHLDFQQFDSGAVRSKDANKTRFDLICPTALAHIAQTYAEGAVKYGDINWTKGMPITDTINHALRHIFLFLNGDRTEDHMVHAAWNLLAVIHFTEECNHHENYKNLKIQDEKYLEQ